MLLLKQDLTQDLKVFLAKIHETFYQELIDPIKIL